MLYNYHTHLMGSNPSLSTHSVGKTHGSETGRIKDWHIPVKGNLAISSINTKAFTLWPRCASGSGCMSTWWFTAVLFIKERDYKPKYLSTGDQLKWKPYTVKATYTMKQEPSCCEKWGTLHIDMEKSRGKSVCYLLCKGFKKKRGYIVLFAFCILHKENTEKIRKNLLTGKARMVVERWLLSYGWD